MRFTWPAAVAAAALAAGFRPSPAQIDYRNLDDDRPVLVEDAYPLERYAFEFLLPYRFEHDQSGRSVHGLIPELEYGILPNAGSTSRSSRAGRRASARRGSTPRWRGSGTCCASRRPACRG